MNAEDRKLLAQARYWMGELHGWLWARKETTRDGPMRKDLIRDIKAIDKRLEETATERAEQ